MDWVSILEASPAELQNIILRSSGPQRCYAEVLFHYLTGSDSELSAAVGRLEREAAEHTEPVVAALLKISHLRQAIRQGRASEVAIERYLGSPFPAFIPRLFEAEHRFVAARAFELIHLHSRAKTLYLECHQVFESADAKRKSVKCLLNHVSMKSRENPKGKYIADYYHIARAAKEIGEPGVAGVALYNISREYQKLGALSAALKNCDAALALLEPDFGSLHYDHAVVHRCHLLIRLKRLVEAQYEYERAKISAFPEIRAAAAVIEEMLSQTGGDRQIENAIPLLSPTWRERLIECQADGEREKAALTAAENRLLQLISESPKDKYALIEALYPAESSFTLLEDRLKNLLMRLRKKRPELIILESGKYRICDEAFVE